MTTRILLIAIALLFTGCQNCTGVGSFTVTRDTEEVIVEGSNSPLNDLLPANVIPALELDFDLQGELEQQDAKGAQAVYLNGLVLRITETSLAEGDEDDFDFLERVEFFVESADRSSDLERVSIAILDPVPDGLTELDLETDDSINLKPYAQEGIVLTSSGRGEVPPDDVSIAAEVTIEIDTL